MCSGPAAKKPAPPRPPGGKPNAPKPKADWLEMTAPPAPDAQQRLSSGGRVSVSDSAAGRTRRPSFRLSRVEHEPTNHQSRQTSVSTVQMAGDGVVVRAVCSTALQFLALPACAISFSLFHRPRPPSPLLLLQSMNDPGRNTQPALLNMVVTTKYTP